MKNLECGNSKGYLVFYFHGVPGAPQEIKLFEPYADKYNLRIICLDRFSIDRSIHGEEYFQVIAKKIDEIAQGAPVKFIGFSIGCSVAIRVAPLLVTKVSRLLLISLAAPLQGGDFLKKMAGAPVFKLARSRKMLFYCLSYFQRILSIALPSLLFSSLFSSANGKDKELRASAEFKQFAKLLYSKCFGAGFYGYTRDAILYSSSWTISPHVGNCPVSIWHGGSDNWSPVEMAHYLASKIASNSDVHVMPRHSHYSCLLESAQEVCEKCGVE